MSIFSGSPTHVTGGKVRFAPDRKERFAKVVAATAGTAVVCPPLAPLVAVVGAIFAAAHDEKTETD